MKRLLATVATLTVFAVAVAVAAAAGAPADATAPSKTTAPGGPSPTGGVPTTLPPPTTVAPPAPTAVAPTVATVAPTVPGGTGPTPTFASPPTASVAGQFDAATFLTGFYTTIGSFPSDAVDLIEQLDPGSPAEVFFLHELFVAVAIFANTNTPLPVYTVTPAGAAFTVCRDGRVCETFGDFVVTAGALVSFTLDGQPIDDRVGGYLRATTVETLTVDGLLTVRRPRDEALSVVMLLTSAGGGTSFTWHQATYHDSTGRPYPLDLSASQFPTRIEDGDGAVAHLAYPLAQAGGQLVFPITSDQTGVPTTVRVPVVTT